MVEVGLAAQEPYTAESSALIRASSSFVSCRGARVGQLSRRCPNNRPLVAGPKRSRYPGQCNRAHRFHHLAMWETGGVDFNSVFQGLRAIGYDGYFTIHQAQGIETVADAEVFARRCAELVRPWL